MSRDPIVDDPPVRIPPANPDDPLDPTGPEPVVLPPDFDPAPDSPIEPGEPETTPEQPAPGTPQPRENPPLF